MLGSPPSVWSTSPKSTILATSPHPATGATSTLSGFMSRWISPASCAPARPPANLVQEEQRARRLHRSVDAHELRQRAAGDELHRVVEEAVRRPAVVVHGDRVRVREPRRRAHLALEAPHRLLVDHVGLEELHRGGPLQHRVARLVDHADAAFADLADERVPAEPAHLVGGLAQAVDHVRGARGDDREGEPPEHRVRDHPDAGSLRPPAARRRGTPSRGAGRAWRGCPTPPRSGRRRAPRPGRPSSATCSGRRRRA